MPTHRLPPLALAYHGVADVPLRHDPDGLFVRPAEVAKHLRALQRWGYDLVSFRELARAASAGEAEGRASLTFDDGLADNLHALAPLLEKEGATATVFVTSGWLGEPYPPEPGGGRMLTVGELRSLHARGVEIGAHTHTHPDLTQISMEDARDELAHSREVLEDLLQAPIETAAYPYGRATAQTRSACRQAGLSAACRTSGEGSWDDPFDLPRQDMLSRSTMAGLRLKRDDRYERLVALPPFRVARGVRRRTLGILS